MLKPWSWFFIHGLMWEAFRTRMSKSFMITTLLWLDWVILKYLRMQGTIQLLHFFSFYWFPLTTVIGFMLYTELHCYTTGQKRFTRKLKLDNTSIMCIFVISLTYITSLWCSHHLLEMQTGIKLLWSCENYLY